MIYYPNEEELEKIKTWDCNDFHGLMSFVHALWELKSWGWSQDGDIYSISTGGWSGNEDLISALKQNMMFWMLYWQRSTRGGHYIFAPMRIDIIEKLSKGT